jgi:hypothetical protein
MSGSDPKDGPPPRTILGVAPPPSRERTIDGVAPPRPEPPKTPREVGARTIHGVAPPAPGAKLARQPTLLGVAVDPNRATPPREAPPAKEREPEPAADDPPARPPNRALELVISSSTTLPAGVAVSEPPVPAAAPVGMSAPRDDIMSLAPAGVPRRGLLGRVGLVVVGVGLGVAGYAERRPISALLDRYVLAPSPSPSPLPSATPEPTASAPPPLLDGGVDDAGRRPSDGGIHRRGPHVPRGRSH